MDKMLITMAYKYVAIFAMLCEVNHCARELNLSLPQPITVHELKLMFAAEPRFDGGMGALDTTEYSFGFSKKSRLRYITRLHPFGNTPLPELHLQQAKLKSQINKEQALELARSWLRALDVSIEDLEAASKPQVEQRWFYADPVAAQMGRLEGNEHVPLPIFDVIWSHGGKKAVIVEIYGPTKELLQLRQEDDSFSRRPSPLVKDFEKLLSISDEEFSNYSESQREELLSKYVNPTPEVTKWLSQISSTHTNVLIPSELKFRTRRQSGTPVNP